MSTHCRSGDLVIAIYDAVVRLIAKIPTMVAAFQLIRKGQDPIQPRDDLAYSANFLYMLTEQEPDPLASRIFDRCLIVVVHRGLEHLLLSAGQRLHRHTISPMIVRRFSLGLAALS